MWLSPAVTAVTAFSNVSISLIRNMIPPSIRIIVQLTVIASLCKSMLVGIFSGVLGIWVSLFGVYDMSKGGNGELRIIPEFMSTYLENGFSLLPLLIGLFGLSVIFDEAQKGVRDEPADNVKLTSGRRFQWSVFMGQFANLIRSSSIGTFVGMLPGVGGSAASVLAYSQTKNFSKDPGKFGTGHPAGVIASLIPTTNPELTPPVTGIYAVKCKDAVIFTPHPRSKATT